MRIFLLAGALLLSACALYERVPSERALNASPAYEKVLVASTRSAEAVELLDVPLRMVATLLTPDFREAFDLEHQRLYGRSVSDESLLGPSLVLVVALAASNRESIELQKNGELWTMAFRSSDGRELQSERVSRIARSDTWFRYFFPYWTPWRSMYRVQFDLPAETDSGTLLFRSVSGEMAVTW